MLYGVDTHRRYFYVQYPNGLVSTYSQDMKNKLLPLVFNDLGRITGRLLKVLYYYDPSTKNPYVSFVPNEINKADEAMAWKFHLTPEEYDRLNIEA